MPFNRTNTTHTSQIGAGNITSHERGSLVSIMPYALLGLYPDNSRVLVFTAYNEWRAIRDGIHTSATIISLEKARKRAQQLILTTFPTRNKQGNGWNFRKFDNMRYYEPWAQRVGPIRLLNSRSGERTNKDMKQA